MWKIVAIWWGEIGRLWKENTTFALDQKIIELTGKKNPVWLFLPTASKDSVGYVEGIQSYFQTRFWVKIDWLFLRDKKFEKQELSDLILSKDFIYVWGGNTLYMMNMWRKLWLDDILRQAYEKGIVLSGMSAGSICWFEYGNSDSRKFTSKEWWFHYIKVRWLWLLPALHCPHYDSEPQRQEDLKNMMRHVSGVAIALCDNTALVVEDEKFQILTSTPEAKAYKVYWKQGEYFREEITWTCGNLEELFGK